MLADRKNIPIQHLVNNTGQIKDVPGNPRSIHKTKYQRLMQSLRDDPEFLEVRELIVYPVKKEYVVIGGNMRLMACRELGFDSLPCKILDKETPAQKLRAIVQKDNVSYGDFDFEALANEWDAAELEHWGVDIPKALFAEDKQEMPNTKSVVKLELVFDNLGTYDLVRDKVFALISDYDGVKMLEHK